MVRIPDFSSTLAVRVVLISFVLCVLPTLLATTRHSLGCDDRFQHWAAEDQNMQSIEAQEITQGVARTRSSYGLALTIDANTGKVLSYYRSTAPAHCNDAWEPGSIMKPLTISAALDTGSINDKFTFYDKGYAIIDGQYVYNWMPFPTGTKNLTTLLGDSLNVGAVAVQRQFKNQQIWHDYLQNHFMLNPDGRGDLAATQNKLGDYRYAISSFGVGLVTTPLQMSLAYAALINGGLYHPACYSSNCSMSGKRVLQPSTSKIIKQLLTIIYSASASSLPAGYAIGAKSGTAPLAQPSSEYLTGQDSGTYVGYVSHNGHTYIQMVRLDQPQGYSAASHAAREIWTDILNRSIIK